MNIKVRSIYTYLLVYGILSFMIGRIVVKSNETVGTVVLISSAVVNLFLLLRLMIYGNFLRR